MPDRSAGETKRAAGRKPAGLAAKAQTTQLAWQRLQVPLLLAKCRNPTPHAPGRPTKGLGQSVEQPYLERVRQPVEHHARAALGDADVCFAQEPVPTDHRSWHTFRSHHVPILLIALVAKLFLRYNNMVA